MNFISFLGDGSGRVLGLVGHSLATACGGFPGLSDRILDGKTCTADLSQPVAPWKGAGRFVIDLEVMFEGVFVKKNIDVNIAER